jgi:soluble lytic murein transglycosylase-like protein
MCAKRLEFMKNRAKLRFMRLFSLILLMLVATHTDAGTLYRCVGSDGISNYTSKKIAGAACTALSTNSIQQPTFSTQLPPAATPTPAAAPPPAAELVAKDEKGVVIATAPLPATELKVPATAVKAAPSTTSAPKFLRMGSSTTYSYVDANGIKNYSSRKPKGVSNIVASRIEYPIFSQPNCYACGVTSAVNFKATSLNTTSFAAEIRAASKAYGVEEAVVRAIIHAESAYRPHVQSNKGAQGLMQLIPATARRFGVADSFDPAQNIDGGVQYLAWLLKRYGQDVTLAAAAYNAGEGAVDKYGGVPPYRETQNYVVRVGQLAERYRKAL